MTRMFARVSTRVSIVVAVLAGCAHPEPSVHAIPGRVDGATGKGILTMLNYPGTTVDELDEDVGLDRRAAEGLIAVRTGPDGMDGTPDDAPFRSLDAVDAVPYVGPVSLERLAAYAIAQGWVPESNDTVGIFEGHALTQREVQQVLDMVNNADVDGLDALLDRRAVDAIVAHRPLAAMETLAALPYVGPEAVADLVVAAVDASPIDACERGSDCGADAVCVAYDDRFAQCQPASVVDGEGDLCQTDAHCGAGLSCVGETVADYGTCTPRWQQKAFTLTAPMGIDGSVVLPREVRSLAPVATDVVVSVAVDHPAPETLTVRLIDPTGTRRVRLTGLEAGPVVVPMDGAPSNGVWRLVVQDPTNEVRGHLRGWSLSLGSSW